MGLAEKLKEDGEFFCELIKINIEQQKIVKKLNEDPEFLLKNDGKYIFMLDNAEPKIYSSGEAVWEEMNKMTGRAYAHQTYFGKITKKTIKDYPVLCEAHQEGIYASRSCDMSNLFTQF